MRLLPSLAASLAVFACASTAFAGLNVAISSSDNLFAMTPGQLFTIDITVTTDTPGEARAMSLRAANWNAGDLIFVSAAIPGVSGLTPNGSVFGTEVAPGFIVSAISNNLPAPVSTPGGPNPNVNLFQGISLDETASAGPEVFSVTFQYNGGVGTIEAGVLPAFLPGDAYVSTGTNTVNNAAIGYGIPEPGTALLLALGLAGLASTRRARD